MVSSFIPEIKTFIANRRSFGSTAHDKSLAIKIGMTISYLIREPLGSGLGDLRSAGFPAIRYSPLSLQIYRPWKRRVKRAGWGNALFSDCQCGIVERNDAVQGVRRDLDLAADLAAAHEDDRLSFRSTVQECCELFLHADR